MLKDRAFFVAFFVIVLLAVIIALIADVLAQEGTHRDFHEFYRSQRNDAHGSCCVTDCQPVLGEWRDGQLYLGLFRDDDGAWVPATDAEMMPTASPDWQYHACWPFSAGEPSLRCWWAPGTS